MRVRIASALMLALAAAQPAHALDNRRFDYVCQGVQSFVKNGVRAGGVPLRQRFHIDLPAGQWCDATCNRVRQIKSAGENRIVLADAMVAGSQERTEINRASGELKATLGDGFGSDFRGLMTRSRCRLASFTPIRRSAF